MHASYLCYIFHLASSLMHASYLFGCMLRIYVTNSTNNWWNFQGGLLPLNRGLPYLPTGVSFPLRPDGCIPRLQNNIKKLRYFFKKKHIPTLRTFNNKSAEHLCSFLTNNCHIFTKYHSFRAFLHSSRRMLKKSQLHFWETLRLKHKTCSYFHRFPLILRRKFNFLTPG